MSRDNLGSKQTIGLHNCSKKKRKDMTLLSHHTDK